MSREIDLLEPEFRKPLLEAIENAKEKGVFMVPYETERSVYRQASLWRQSRPTSYIQRRINWLQENGAQFLGDVLKNVGPSSGPWVTNALPGLSWHQWGLACDLYWDKNGPAPGGVEWSNLEGYRVFAEEARKLGLTSGYFWSSRDAVHVQLPKKSKPQMTIQEISESMRVRYAHRN